MFNIYLLILSLLFTQIKHLLTIGIKLEVFELIITTNKTLIIFLPIFLPFFFIYVTSLSFKEIS